MPCLKHEEQIKILFDKHKALTQRVDNNANMKDTLIEMKVLMGAMVGHGKKQDDINEKQNNTLVNMNSSLIAMNQTIMSVDNRVQTLEQRANENESKHIVDTRDIQKLKHNEVITTYGVSLGIFSAAVIAAPEVIKITKDNLHEAWYLYLEEYPKDPTRPDSTFIVEIEANGDIDIYPDEPAR